MIIDKCNICPRNCGARRDNIIGDGFCKMPSSAYICRAALHFDEEPDISGKNGSGAIFFSGCVLRCEFCQNIDISRLCVGKPVDEHQLIEYMTMLEEKGAHNINFVTPTHFSHIIKRALNIKKPKIPVIYNCSGYESVNTLQSLDGLIDVYLPDLKYSNDNIGKKYSGVDNYFSIASVAIKEMYNQVKEICHNDEGLIQKGVIIRHLVLPNNFENSAGVIDYVAKNFGDNVYFSLMAQYMPNGKNLHTEISRKITQAEYDKVYNYMIEKNITQGFCQEVDSADEKYIPSWDLL